MPIENALLPTADQLNALLGHAHTGPIHMLNLLKFHARAAYDDPAQPPVSGLEAYMRYGMEVQKLVEARGGRLVYSAAPLSLVIGSAPEMWDMVAIAEYPSPQAFVEMALSPEMNAIAHHRKAGLEGQLLIMLPAAPAWPG